MEKKRNDPPQSSQLEAGKKQAAKRNRTRAPLSQKPYSLPQPRTPPNKHKYPPDATPEEPWSDERWSPTPLGYTGRDDLTQPDPLQGREPEKRTPPQPRRGYLPGTQGRYKLVDPRKREAQKGMAQSEKGDGERKGEKEHDDVKAGSFVVGKTTLSSGGLFSPVGSPKSKDDGDAVQMAPWKIPNDSNSDDEGPTDATNLSGQDDDALQGQTPAAKGTRGEQVGDVEVPPPPPRSSPTRTETTSLSNPSVDALQNQTPLTRETTFGGDGPAGEAPSTGEEKLGETSRPDDATGGPGSSRSKMVQGQVEPVEVLPSVEVVPADVGGEETPLVEAKASPRKGEAGDQSRPDTKETSSGDGGTPPKRGEKKRTGTIANNPSGDGDDEGEDAGSLADSVSTAIVGKEHSEPKLPEVGPESQQSQEPASGADKTTVPEPAKPAELPRPVQEATPSITIKRSTPGAPKPQPLLERTHGHESSGREVEASSRPSPSTTPTPADAAGSSQQDQEGQVPVKAQRDKTHRTTPPSVDPPLPQTPSPVIHPYDSVSPRTINPRWRGGVDMGSVPLIIGEGPEVDPTNPPAVEGSYGRGGDQYIPRSREVEPGSGPTKDSEQLVLSPDETRIIARTGALLGQEFSDYHRVAFKEANIVALGEKYIEQAERWLAKDENGRSRDSLVANGLFDGHAHLAAKWRTDNGVETAGLIKQLGALTHGLEKRRGKQMEMLQHDCFSEVKGFLERQLERLTQLMTAVKRERENEPKRIFGEKTRYPSETETNETLDPKGGDALTDRDASLRGQMILGAKPEAMEEKKRIFGSAQGAKGRDESDGPEGDKTPEKDPQRKQTMDGDQERGGSPSEGISASLEETSDVGIEALKLYSRIEPFVQESPRLDDIFHRRALRLCGQEGGPVDASEIKIVTTFLRFLIEKNRITSQYLGDIHGEPSAGSDLLQEVDDLRDEFSDVWELYKLPRSALGRLALLKAKMLWHIEGPKGQRVQLTLAEVESYGFPKDPDISAVYRKLVDDMRRNADRDTRELDSSCGCSFEARKCKDHNETKCGCEHVGIVVLCGEHDATFKDQYYIEVLPSRFAKPRTPSVEQPSGGNGVGGEE